MVVVAYEAMNFPDKLQKLIDLRDTSQSELSRKTGISQSAISEMTKDKRRPYMDQSLSLARALGVPLDYLADDSLDELPKSTGDPSGLSLEQQMVLKAMDAFGFEETWRRLHPPPEGPVEFTRRRPQSESETP